MFLLITMIAAGDLSLKLVDTLNDHPNVLFLSDAARVEEWLFMHDGTLCANGVAALRAKLPELDNKPVGYEVKVYYRPRSRREFVRSSDLTPFTQGNS